MQCPTCKGTGKVTIKVTTFGQKGSENFETDCLTCHGKGRITLKQARQLKKEQDSWCRCGNKSGKTDFHDDGELGAGSEHCWTCSDCGKLTQVG